MVSGEPTWLTVGKVSFSKDRCHQRTEGKLPPQNPFRETQPRSAHLEPKPQWRYNLVGTFNDRFDKLLEAEYELA